MSFSIPISVTSTGGSVVHIRPFPSDSTTQTVPVSATPKLGPRDADLRVQELFPEVEPGDFSEVRGFVGEVVHLQLAHKYLPDLRPVLMNGRYQDMRRRLVGELDYKLREVRFVGRDAFAFEVLVQLGLIGGY